MLLLHAQSKRTLRRRCTLWRQSVASLCTVTYTTDARIAWITWHAKPSRHPAGSDNAGCWPGSFRIICTSGALSNSAQSAILTLVSPDGRCRRHVSSTAGHWTHGVRWQYMRVLCAGALRMLGQNATGVKNTLGTQPRACGSNVPSLPMACA